MFGIRSNYCCRLLAHYEDFKDHAGWILDQSLFPRPRPDCICTRLTYYVGLDGSCGWEVVAVATLNALARSQRVGDRTRVR